MLKKVLIAALTSLTVTLGGHATAFADDIRIGVISILEGAFGALGEDGVRGVDLAIQEFGGEIAGKSISFKKVSSDASPESAVNAARKLIENDGVEIIVGPLSGGEGIAIRDFAKDYPHVTFLNGSSAAQDTTLRTPASNFYRFGGDGAQWQAGLGTYAFEEKGYKRVVTIAEDYSFPYTQVQGFMLEFCEVGGRVPEKFWVPIGNKDFNSIIYSIPENVDAMYVALGGADAVNFLTQYHQAGGKKPIIGGTITIDQSILDSKGPFRELLIGAPAGTPTVGDYDNPEWKKFADSYRKAFPDAFSSPTIFAHHYYMSAKAALLGLEEVKGDLSNDHKAYRAALDKLSFVSPTGGKMRVDHNRNGIVDNFITEVVERGNGTLGNRVIKVVRDINQTLGMDEAEFLKRGPVSRDNPSCP